MGGEAHGSVDAAFAKLLGWRRSGAGTSPVVAGYYRTNLAMRQLAPLFGISPVTVCRAGRSLGLLLSEGPAPKPVAGTDRLWIVDGTRVPVCDRRVTASSRNYRISVNGQANIVSDTRLVIASARPTPGKKADAHAWREPDLPATAAGTTVIWDGAYLGNGLIVPRRRRVGRPLLRAQGEGIAEH